MTDRKKTLLRRETAKITIQEEIKDFIVPPTGEELVLLENSILTEGCREPLIVWEKNNSLILVDGHNRYKICKKHSIPFKILKIQFENIEDAKLWMLDNQMGRRNLTIDQLSYYRGLKYLTLKKGRGGYEKVLKKGDNESSTSDQLADIFNVSSSTVKRDGKFAEGINIIGRSNPKLRNEILIGGTKVKKADVQVLVDAKNPGKLTIRNEADLYNKAKQIRDELLDEVESKVKALSEKRLIEANKVLDANEPLFKSKDDRIRKIKGMIISAINSAILKKDKNAIKELKLLIDRLSSEIFD